MTRKKWREQKGRAARSGVCFERARCSVRVLVQFQPDNVSVKLLKRLDAEILPFMNWPRALCGMPVTFAKWYWLSFAARSRA